MRGRAGAGLFLAACLAVPTVLPALGVFADVPAAAARPPVDRVLVVTLPAVTWTDLRQTRLPHLERLVSRAGVAGLSVRAVHLRTVAGDGYATIGAGTRMSGMPKVDNLAFGVSERFEDGPAAEAYERRLGAHPRGALFTLAGPALGRENAGFRRGARFGALGAALSRAGVHRAVLGNADQSLTLSDPPTFHREAVVALAREDGTVERGKVDRTLLVPDPAAPFGLRLDLDAIERNFRAVWRPRSVVLVEASDLARVEAYTNAVTPAQHRVLLGRALRNTDDLLGRLLTGVDPAHDAVLVAGPNHPGDVAQLTPLALRAPGTGPSLLRSSTTRRAGFVTLADLGPTVLDLFGLDQPAAMEGGPVEIGRHRRAGPAPAWLVDADRRARFRDRITGPVTGVFIAAESLLAAAAVLLLVFRIPWARGAVSFAALCVLGVLPLTHAAVAFDLADPVVYFGFVAGGACLLALAARKLGGNRPLAPLAMLLGLLFALLVVDVVTGARLQLNAVFGYSPTRAGRFAGFGNIAFAELAASAVVLAALAVHCLGGRRGLQAGAAILGVALVADGMPMWGSDVGGVMACVPAFGISLAGLAHWKRSRWTGVALAVVTAASVALFAALDLLRPAASRTHLGGLVERMGDEGWNPFGLAISRKAAASLGGLTESVWILMPIVAGALVVYLICAPGGPLLRVFERVPPMRPALAGVLALGILGFALNDSGIAVPGMAAAVVTPVVVYLSAWSSA